MPQAKSVLTALVVQTVPIQPVVWFLAQGGEERVVAAVRAVAAAVRAARAAVGVGVEAATGERLRLVPRAEMVVPVVWAVQGLRAGKAELGDLAALAAVLLNCRRWGGSQSPEIS